MQSIKLSIIVPIYNVELYLRKCVESLLPYTPLPEGNGVGQDLSPEEYEIILVDDGSTDGSGQLAEQLAGQSAISNQSSVASCQQSVISCQSSAVSLQQSPITNNKSQIIKVLHQPNGGLSAARNTGIRAAKGDYVCFVDSDDYWEPNVLAGLMTQVERDDLDVLRFKWQNVRMVSGLEDERYEVFNPNKSDPYRLEDYSSAVTTGKDFLNTRFGYACYAVQFIVRRSLLSGQYSVFSTQCSEVSNQQSVVSRQSSAVSSQLSVFSGQSSAISNQKSQITNNKSPITNNKSSIFFTPGLHFEDTDWTPRMLLAAQRVASTDTMVYDYLVREGSITKVGANLDKKRRNIEDSMLIVERLGGLLEQYPSCVWLRRMQSSMAAGIIHSVVTAFPAERRDYVRRLRQLHVFPLVIANQGRTYARRARIMNISVWLYAIIAKLR